MQVKCIVIDDEPLAIEKLNGFISRISWLSPEESFNNAIDALNYLKTKTVDLIFLDIQMDDFSGLQFLEALKNRPFIIITSAYKEYAIQGYDFEVTDYLLKPFGFERFIIAVEKVYAQHAAFRQQKRDYIFLKTGYSMERVNLSEILYIEGMNEYLQVVTHQHKFMTLQNFRDMEALLFSDNFTRVHKSFIVALDKIEKIERNVIIIRDKRIPVGKSYKEEFNEILKLN